MQYNMIWSVGQHAWWRTRGDKEKGWCWRCSLSSHGFRHKTICKI